MSFPASLTTRTVTGRFVTYPGGAPAVGRVRITLNDYMQGPTEGAFVAPFTASLTLDSNGEFSVVLPATNDPQWTPSYYRVTITIGDKTNRHKFQVPFHETGPLDLAEVLNVPPPTPGETYIFVSTKGVPGGVASLDDDGKIPTTQLPAGAGGDVSWDDIDDKPSVFPHDEVTYGQVTEKPSTFPPSAHAHDYTSITDKPTTFPPSTHSHAKSEVGLDSADNTSDVNKPVSTAQQTALNLKAPLASPTFTGTVSGVTAAMVGLPNVNNTSDAAKPVSTAQQIALDLKANVASPTLTGTPAAPTATGGTNTTQIATTAFVSTAVAPKADASAVTTALANKADLVGGVIPTSQMPSLSINDTFEVTSQAAMLALTAQRGDVAVRTDLTPNRMFFLIADAPGTLANWKEVTAAGSVLTINGQSGNVTLVKSDIGLGNADNTSDVNKPVSTAQQTALNLKAPLASPTFTGTVSGITASMVGLGNASNTSDASKPVSTATQNALNAKMDVTRSAVRYPAKANGCKADVKSTGDAAMASGSNTLTSVSANFTPTDVGKQVFVGSVINTTITSYVNAQTVTVGVSSGSTISGAYLTWGTVDSSSLQALINSVAASGGGVIDLDTGVYFAEITMAPKVTLTGGQGTYHYSYPAAATLVGVTPGGTVIDTPSTASDSIAIEGVTVLGGPFHQSPASSVGIRFRDVSFSMIRRVMVNWFRDQGILLAAGAASGVDEVLITNVLLNRARLGVRSGAIEVRGTDAYISRSEFNASLNGGKSELDMNCYGVLVTGAANFFSQCVGELSDGGWYVGGHYNQFVDCRGDLNQGHGWTVATGFQSGYNMFAACLALNNGRDALNTYSGFKVTSLGNVFAACKNIQNGSGWGSSKYAFEDTTTPSSAKDVNEFSACSGDYVTGMILTPRTNAQVFTADGIYAPPPSATLLQIEALGGYGGGGGGGSALSAGGTTTQVGGGGGATPLPKTQIVPATTLYITIGAGGGGGTGGVINGNAGASGGNGGDTVIGGSGITAITAKGARGGAGGAANSATAVGGGQYGVGATTTNQSLGSGGFASSGVGAGGGAAPGLAAGAGGGAAPANATNGGNAGNSGTVSDGGSTSTGQGGTANGINATPGAGGGGGGGGGAPGGTGGNGAAGAGGYVLVTVIA